MSSLAVRRQKIIYLFDYSITNVAQADPFQQMVFADVATQN